MAQKKAGGKSAKDVNKGKLPMPFGQGEKSGKTAKKGNQGQGKKKK